MDVLVVGAGPVGLTMAAELARYGLSVRIIEKAAARTDKSKALVLWSRTLEMLDRSGAGPRFVDAGTQVTAANIVAGDKTLARVTLDKVESPHPYALMLPQSETERLLEEHLNGFGVRVERQGELLNFADSGASVRASIRHADGTEEAVEASWLLGCDGAHSTVRHQLGMEFAGDTLQSDWFLADVHLSGVKMPGEIAIYWHADGVLAIFPISGDRCRVLADVGATHAGRAQGDPTLAEVQAVLDRRGPGGIIASEPIWLSGFHINERKVKDFRLGRVFLAGDAAHVHSPAGGQGMNTGMQDACNLAWKLALVDKGKCAAEPMLGSYSIERSAVGDEVLKNSGRLTSLGVMEGGFKQGLRNGLFSMFLGLEAARDEAAEQLTELAIHYPKSPLNGHHELFQKGPKPGERAPIRSAEAPAGGGDSPKFVVYGDKEGQAAAVIARYAGLLDREIRKPFEDGGMWLVRPDGYVAVAAKRADWARVEDYFAEIGAAAQQ